MAQFSKEMMARCAKVLKFLVPHTGKFTNPDYAIPDADLEKLQMELRKITLAFFDAPEAVRQEYRAIADDVESLRRLEDFLQKTRTGLIQANIHTEVLTIQKRLTSIKVILNKELGKAPQKNPFGCIFILVLFVGIIIAGWFFRDALQPLLDSALKKTEEIQKSEETVETESDEVVSEEEKEAAQGEIEVSEEPKTSEKINSSPQTESVSEAESPAKVESDSISSNKTVNSKSSSRKNSSVSGKKKNAKKISQKSGKHPVRTWTDREGNKYKARFLRIENGIVFLEYRNRTNGLTEKGYAIENFSIKDQEFIKELEEK